MKSDRKKVYIGMSGGVDSSVSALLLKNAGYDVTGVFIKVWQPDWITCTWKEDRLDAMRVASQLDIPFITLDLENEYKKEVVDYMIREYTQGRTPNPDVMCNRYVKFGGFYDWAIKQGADYVATGHYARTEFNKQTSHHELKVGLDSNKDQTYFLWTLTQEQLSKTLFPIGHLQKSEVRDLAQKNNLINAQKKDSQGLCFIGKIDIKDFLSRYIDVKPGNVLNEKGEVIGTHTGSELYTIGERHGFTIHTKSPDDKPWYIIRKNISNNTLTVSHSTTSETQHVQKTVRISHLNWNQLPYEGTELSVRFRYRAPLVKSKVIDSHTLELIDPYSPITPGQSVVFYMHDVCVGGAIIEE